MTIDQVIDLLIKEKQDAVASRFPCRAVMVKNVTQYQELLSKLKRIPDVNFVSAEELFSAPDVMPRYENLKDEKYRDQWLVLPGVSEYLRLFGKSEADSQRFAKLWSCQRSASSRGRIIIPLWGCLAQWHDKALHLCEDSRQDDFFYDCSDENAADQKLELLILSGEFESYASQLAGADAQTWNGLKSWYAYWAAPFEAETKHVLVTKRHGFIQPAAGNISIRVIRDSLSFIRENLSGASVLDEKLCPKDAQTLLFPHALKGGTLDNAILASLNIFSFADVDVMRKWDNLDLGRKQLIMLWLKLHPDESYLHHCAEAGDISSLSEHILHDIFELYNSHPTWLAESQALISAMMLTRDTAYFKALDRVPVYEKRLAFLSGNQREERIYLLRLVGKWMREDAGQVRSSQTLLKLYPALAAYLDNGGYDSDLSRYFSLYKSHKLENSLPDDEGLYFSGFQAEHYDYRFPVISNALTEDCVVLWIDALGAEWLPLLLWSLEKDTNGSVKECAVTQATLPSETCYNDQWNQMELPHDKLDRLDKLAHKGIIDDPDYYACIEDQLSFVAKLSDKVDALLEEYHRVIITGDHGTSRLAARFFHKREGIPVPANAEVGSHGRFCRLAENTTFSHPNIINTKGSDGNRYASFSNYDHFSRSGFATAASDDNALYGEIHGGASPEEMLVPVVVFDSLHEKALKASWKSATVKIMAKKAKVSILFNRPVLALQARINAIEGLCTPNKDNKVWTIVFPGVAPGTYSVSVAADGSLVPLESLKILPALGGGEGDLP